jgi:hypothetical protein
MAASTTDTPRIPMRHLSVRVPWHDSGWNGTVCQFPRKNASCLVLNRIGATKDDVVDERHKGEQLDKIPPSEAPPCFSERVNFMSPRAQQRLAHHAYSDTSEHHNHISDTPFRHPPYSAAATPFGWLLKERAWGKDWKKGRIDSQSLAERYGIEAHPEYEPKEPGWLEKRPWIQGDRNQKALLNAFFDALKPERSLVFVYASAPRLRTMSSGSLSALVASRQSATSRNGITTRWTIRGCVHTFGSGLSVIASGPTAAAGCCCPITTC